ncbi:hypothetical protein ES703_29668 [subsurface metagenome]
MMLLSICLSIVIGILVKAYALPIVLRIIAVRNWFYALFAGEEGKAQCEEILANLHDEINDYRLAGDSNEVIAARIFLHLVTGLPGDIARCAPFVPSLLVDKIMGWGDNLRHYRIPTAMIAGVATLVPMNYSFFSSNNQTFFNWLIANGIVVVITVLLWKIKHPLVRRIFYSWMGVAMIAAVAVMVWVSIQYRLYEIMTFKILMLAMIAVLPAIIVVDKSWRSRLFKSRWWLIPICWTPIIAGAFTGSLLIAHSVKPLLEMWAVMALLVVGMFIVYGTMGLAAYVLCWLGIRGSAGGLCLVASGIRRFL